MAPKIFCRKIIRASVEVILLKEEKKLVSLIFTTFLIKELIYEEGGELQRVNFDRHNLISWLSWLDLTFEGYSFVFSAIQKNQY